MSDKRKYTITLDDDRMVAKIIEQSTGIESRSYLSAQALLEEMTLLEPIAVFVDVHLDGQNGLDVVPQLRAHWFECPIIVITGDDDDQAIVQALARGADDFVVKPLRPGELRARLQARLTARAAQDGKRILRMGDVIFDCAHRALKGKAGLRHLSPTTANLLECLWHARGTVVVKETLKWQGWGELVVSDSALDRKIHELRAVLQESSRELHLDNSYGEGFALHLRAANQKAPDTGAKKGRRTMKTGKSQLMDEAKLESLRQLGDNGNFNFLQEVATMFLTDAPPVFRTLTEAVKAGDAEETRRAAHKLKGMCFNIGATALANHCEALEQMGKQGKTSGGEAHLTSYQKDYERVTDYLSSHLKLAA